MRNDEGILRTKSATLNLRRVNARFYDVSTKRLVKYAPRPPVPEAFKAIEKDRVSTS